jgi:hypothetical protein
VSQKFGCRNSHGIKDVVALDIRTERALKDANGGAVFYQRHGVEMNGLCWIDGAGFVEDDDRKEVKRRQSL